MNKPTSKKVPQMKPKLFPVTVSYLIIIIYYSRDPSEWI